MTIDQFVKDNNLPEMKLLGEMANFKYYIKKNIPDNIEEGPPMVIVENKSTNTFSICDVKQGMKAIAYFKEK